MQVVFSSCQSHQHLHTYSEKQTLQRNLIITDIKQGYKVEHFFYFVNFYLFCFVEMIISLSVVIKLHQSLLAFSEDYFSFNNKKSQCNKIMFCKSNSQHQSMSPSAVMVISQTLHLHTKFIKKCRSIQQESGRNIDYTSSWLNTQTFLV